MEINILCNNKKCPFKDCIFRSSNYDKKDIKVPVVNLQSSCKTYAKYIADCLNKNINIF